MPDLTPSPSTAVQTYTPAPVVQSSETSSMAVAAQAKAAIEARYVMAMRAPRDWDIVRERLMKECRRPGFAASAIYHKPIGNGVEGASIRFVEAAMRCMTNLLPEVTTVYDDPEKRIVRVSVTDLEANLTYTKDVTITKTVERRYLKKGESPLKTRMNSRNEQIFIMEATDDDILNKENALVSKTLRTLGLRVLPGDIHDEALALCRHVRRDEDAKDPAAAKKALFDCFSDLGVSVDQLKEYLGHKADVLNPKELEELRGLFAALRDGETSWREIIDARKPAEPSAGDGATKQASPAGGSSLKDAIKGNKAADAAKVQDAAPVKAAPAPDPEKAPDSPKETPTPEAAPEAPTPAAAPAQADAKPSDSPAWLSEPQKKLLFAIGKKQNPVCNADVVRHIIHVLDGMGKAGGLPYFNAIADSKPDSVSLWAQARARVAASTKYEAAPPPPPPPPSADPDGF